MGERYRKKATFQKEEGKEISVGSEILNVSVPVLGETEMSDTDSELEPADPPLLSWATDFALKPS